MASSPSLLDALYRLGQHVEGRRTARKALHEAARRLADHLAGELRTKDLITVDGRTVEVGRIGYYGCQGAPDSGWPHVRCPRKEEFHAVVLDGDLLLHRNEPTSSEAWFDGKNQQRSTGRYYLVHRDAPAGPLDEGDTTDLGRPTDRDLTWFAQHAAAIVSAFGDLLKTERETMTAATQQARTQRV
jgi:hypothetical protein